MDKIKEIEELTQAIESQIAVLLQQNQNLETLENTFEENLEAAKFSKELSYFLSTVYLSQQKMLGKLDNKDPVLKNMKKIQEKEIRIKKVESILAAKKPQNSTVDPLTYQKLFIKEEEVLRKRSRL